ncbi:hypothetical protein RRG08_044777 [Elysia crispata]|uniref:Uncharacterized protein n=1 Tax=Elysia crispata TaxID=231223 RepID=A0AAE0ZU99_9GAST|nr:hypothetical protein RRG08_044777 [Elysia crispata]
MSPPSKPAVPLPAARGHGVSNLRAATGGGVSGGHTDGSGNTTGSSTAASHYAGRTAAVGNLAVSGSQNSNTAGGGGGSYDSEHCGVRHIIQ